VILLAILSPVCWILAAFCNAVMDTLADKPHFDKSIFSKYDSDFWLKTDSWDNKYNDIDGDGEGDVKGGLRYKGVLGFLNNLSDGWHIFQSLMIIFLAMSCSLGIFVTELFVFDSLFLNLFTYFIFLGIAWNVTFSAGYDKILKKK